MNRVVRIFSDVHLGNGIDGLEAIAKKHQLNMSTLPKGAFTVFVNRRRTALKMVAGGSGVVAYMKLRSGEKVDLSVIASLPTYFNGDEINYKGAIREKLLKQFPHAERVSLA